jgi:hypothetical protein
MGNGAEIVQPLREIRRNDDSEFAVRSVDGCCQVIVGAHIASDAEIERRREMLKQGLALLTCFAIERADWNVL